MLRMPEKYEKMYDEWVKEQLASGTPIEKPKELREYLEERRRIVEKAEANGCLIG